MFPCLTVSVSGLDPLATYSVFMDIVPADTNRYRLCTRSYKWIVLGKPVEPVLCSRYFHPESPKTGEHWMQRKISFKKAKVTNNKKTVWGYVSER